MNIIVFGGTGFFGKAFVSEMKKQKHINVYTIVRNHSDRNLANQYFLYEDVDALLDKDKTFDIAIDFASHVSVDDFLADPQEAFLDNLKIPINNIKFLNNLCFAGNYIYVSTDRAILDIRNADSIVNVKISNDPYGASKLVGEIIVRYCSSLRDGSSTIARFPNIYGPGQTSRQLIPTIVDKLDRGDHVIELASISGERNYLFISDAVSAMIKLVKRTNYEKEICISGENITIKMILESFERACLKKYGRRVKFIAKSSKPLRGDFKTPPKNLDDSYFRENYHWEPIVDIEQGISLTLQKEN
mgnify:CR=1 FL=1